jgi:hypothetical protein
VSEAEDQLSNQRKQGRERIERRSAEPKQLASAPIHRSNEAAPLPLRGQERCKENDACASTATQSGKLQGVRSAERPYNCALYSAQFKTYLNTAKA